MKRAPAWDAEEFETLLQNPGLDDDAVAELTSRRSVGAVEVVRQGLHAYHTGMNTSMLSEVMKEILARRKGSVQCPICKDTF